jgi:ABC-2 type transport system ATP-binding protein
MKKSRKNDLEISKLNKVYINKNNRVTALKNISFNVKKGAMLALLGPNGAGKSSLINILSGIVNKSSGRIAINGFDVDKDIRSAKLSIGVVPQELVIDPYFTPRETLNFQAGYYGIKNSNSIADNLLEKLKLRDKANAYVRNLSGGMKRRLMIAKAMVHAPQILILDEPTAGVDVGLRNLLWENIRELNKKGTTILITTHYLEEAEALCEDVAIINKGKIVINGNIKSLIKNIDKKSLNIILENSIKLIPKSLKSLGFEIKEKQSLYIEFSPNKYSVGFLISQVLENNLIIKDIAINEAKLEDLFKKIVD